MALQISREYARGSFFMFGTNSIVVAFVLTPIDVRNSSQVSNLPHSKFLKLWIDNENQNTFQCFLSQKCTNVNSDSDELGFVRLTFSVCSTLRNDHGP